MRTDKLVIIDPGEWPLSPVLCTAAKSVHTRPVGFGFEHCVDSQVPRRAKAGKSPYFVLDVCICGSQEVKEEAHQGGSAKIVRRITNI